MFDEILRGLSGIQERQEISVSVALDDDEAWATINSTVSRPFPRPTSGKVAVNVINHYGDEVMKVIEQRGSRA